MRKLQIHFFIRFFRPTGLYAGCEPLAWAALRLGAFNSDHFLIWDLSSDGAVYKACQPLASITSSRSYVYK